MRIWAGRLKGLQDATAILGAQSASLDAELFRSMLRPMEETLSRSDLLLEFEQLLSQRNEPRRVKAVWNWD